MKDVNPFPQYPVSQLGESQAAVDRRTWATEAIRAERAAIANWVRQPDKPLIMAVIGDYGSGKTHLLIDAMITLRDQLERVSRPCGFLPVVGLAEDPLGWYKAEIGPKLSSLPLTDLVLAMYAEAGKEVAGRAQLTEAAVETLDRKPEAILGLVRGDLLSSTEVEAVFQAKLAKAIPGAHPVILRALALLRWHEADEARQWLAGGELTDDQARRLELPASIATDERALQALLAVAALHHATGRVFALFVDEAEHFLRTGDGGDQNPNVTTMKRLLEGLAQHHAVAFVAGHWSAWETLRDYHDRFSPATPIELARLTGDQVRHLVATRVPGAPDFGAEQSALVARLGAGNMRSITSLLRELYELSDGFADSLSVSQIESAAESVGQRPKPETIILRTHELLESFGFTVASKREVADAEFDLVAFRGNRPQVVVTLKHASHEIAQGEQVRRLIDQMRQVNAKYPDTVGCFLSQGRLDEAVRALFEGDSASRIVLCEVTGPDFAENLSGQLRPLLGTTVAPGEARQVEGHRLWAINNIDRLQTAREEGLDRLLGSVGRDVIIHNTTSNASSHDDYRDRLTVTYEELTRPVSLTTRLSRVCYSQTFAATFVAGLGFFVAIFTIAQGSVITGYEVNVNLVIAIQYLLAFTLLFAGAFVIVRDYIQIERFYEFRNRQLRSIYLRSEDPGELVDAADKLQDALDRYGPRWAVHMFGSRRRRNYSRLGGHEKWLPASSKTSRLPNRDSIST